MIREEKYFWIKYRDNKIPVILNKQIFLFTQRMIKNNKIEYDQIKIQTGYDGDDFVRGKKTLLIKFYIAL